MLPDSSPTEIHPLPGLLYPRQKTFSMRHSQQKGAARGARTGDPSALDHCPQAYQPACFFPSNKHHYPQLTIPHSVHS